jgi:hypothetical protein
MQVYEYRRAAVKRDMDFIREILLRVEDDPRLNGSHFVVFNTSDFEGRTQDEIAYHIDLLFENDFVKGIATLDAPAAAVSRLTWRGHEFIADTRDPGIWEKVKERTKGLPDVAISAVWEIAKAEVRKRLKLP